MDLEQIVHKLEEALELEDWKLVEESIDNIRDHIYNPLNGYDEEEW